MTLLNSRSVHKPKMIREHMWCQSVIERSERHSRKISIFWSISKLNRVSMSINDFCSACEKCAILFRDYHVDSNKINKQQQSINISASSWSLLFWFRLAKCSSPRFWIKSDFGSNGRPIEIAAWLIFDDSTSVRKGWEALTELITNWNITNWNRH